ncbi:ATP-binding cassette subfamily F protein 3 [Natronospira proteinivora]|uniref:ATP-binding cassette subfamily F protein 3 n=1 Tax=Natronospira proteinivora TaxID=1807133 RepID=A0ABT1G8X3_9GAMM|nr:ATP-binding cassette domain-containing protein [Natronospira proteinivora]MCP1727769.1 ATP-binding cassette subfamily F protein 3 [Natronospira proteinivora]
MIQLSNISLRRGRDFLLEETGTTLFPGHKVGLVGANGTGKSTLFALFMGELSVDAGDVSLPSDWVIAHMAQEFTDLDRPAIEFVLDGDPAFRAAEAAVAEAEAQGEGEAIARAHAQYGNADGYSARARAGELLNGLGFAAAAHERPVSAFSGGWRVRLGLAQALMCPSDLLLLDEPTNHLDLEAVLWLEEWLRRYQGTLLLVSHDREFLDGVVDEILHIEHQRLNHYSGNYSEFERQRAADLARQQALYEKQQREIEHMQKFVDRFRYKATKAKAAQSRIKAMERMEKLAPAHVDSPFDFQFPEPPRAGSPLIKLEDVSLGYGETTILRDIELSIAPGDRIGLLGPNGAGKSTLIQALSGELEPSAGTIHRGANLRIGYFAQHQLEQLDLKSSPLMHLQRLAPKVSEQALRNFIGGFGFHGDMATGPVAPLSGGEKARLVLALLVWQAPNLLLLDEPTNHLDLEMRHALTMALQGFEGAVITVSHDRHLLNSTVEAYQLVCDGTVSEFDGDLKDYRNWLDQRRQADNAERRAQAPAKSNPGDRKAARRAAAERRQALKPLRDKAGRLMKALEARNEELAKLETALADPDLYEDENKDRMTALLKQQAELKQTLASLESDWMAAEEAVEAAEREIS